MSHRRSSQFERGDPRDRTRRDLQRLRNRDPSGGFLRHVALIGSVGWPIVALTTGGGLLGHALDQRYGTGVRATLALVFLGAVLGSYAAWRSIRGPRG